MSSVWCDGHTKIDRIYVGGMEVKHNKQAGDWVATHIGDDEIFRAKKTGKIIRLEDYCTIHYIE